MISGGNRYPVWLIFVMLLGYPALQTPSSCARRDNAVGARLDERGRRLFAAVEVRSAGRGDLALLSKITGFARSTINRGEDDLDGEPLAKGRVRRAGGGRRSVSEADPGLVPRSSG
jgi:hypothetical protein